MINLILFALCVAIFYKGFKQFKAQKENPGAREYQPTMPVTMNIRGYYKQREIANHWRKERNKISNDIR